MNNPQSPIPNPQHNAVEQRRRYVTAFNSTMIKIWRERISLLKVVDTGALYLSLLAVGMRADGRFVEISLSQSFNTYGIFQDYGTGRETPRGNPGDIGRDKLRQRRPWFSQKYYASVMNLKDFYAESLGKQFLGIVADALNDKAMRLSVTR